MSTIHQVDGVNGWRDLFLDTAILSHQFPLGIKRGSDEVSVYIVDDDPFEMLDVDVLESNKTSEQFKDFPILRH